MEDLSKNKGVEKVFNHPEPRVLLKQEGPNLQVLFDARVFRHYFLCVDTPSGSQNLFGVNRPGDSSISSCLSPKVAGWFDKHITISSETVDELVKKGNIPPDINYGKIDRLGFWEQVNLEGYLKNANVLVSISLPKGTPDDIEFRIKRLGNGSVVEHSIVGKEPVKVVRQRLGSKAREVPSRKERKTQLPHDLEQEQREIKIDGNAWSKIVGQEEAVAKAQQVVSAILHPEVYHEVGANPPRELLLYGPPGTGKTLLAEVMCEASGAELVSVPCGQIDKPLAGKAEDYLTSFFNKAYSLAKSGKSVVLFLDELNALAKNRSAHIQPWEINLVTILLQQLQKIQKEYPTIAVVATTNLVENVDKAALRSGRFTLKEEMGYPRTHEEILRLLDYAVGTIRIRASQESGAQQNLFEPQITENFRRIEEQGLPLVGNASQADIIEGVNRVVAEKKRLEIEKGRGWQPVSAAEIYEGISSITRIHEKNLSKPSSAPAPKG